MDQKKTDKLQTREQQKKLQHKHTRNNRNEDNKTISLKY